MTFRGVEVLPSDVFFSRKNYRNFLCQNIIANIEAHVLSRTLELIITM